MLKFDVLLLCLVPSMLGTETDMKDRPRVCLAQNRAQSYYTSTPPHTTHMVLDQPASSHNQIEILSKWLKAVSLTHSLKIHRIIWRCNERGVIEALAALFLHNTCIPAIWDGFKIICLLPGQLWLAVSWDHCMDMPGCTVYCTCTVISIRLCLMCHWLCTGLPPSLQETCRHCQVDWVEHSGLRCEDVEKKDETHLRLK